MNTLKKIRKNLIKIIMLFTFLFPIFFFLNNGFSFDYWKLAQALIFTVVFINILVWPDSKKNYLGLSLFLLITMIILYIFKLIIIAEIVGSTGIGIIYITLLCYLPQLIRLGYIKKL